MAAFGDFIGWLRGGGYDNTTMSKAQTQDLAYSPQNQAAALQTAQQALQPYAPAPPPPTSAPSGGDTTAYNSNTDPNQVTAARSVAQGDLGNINNLYQQLFGGVDNQVRDQSNQLTNNYNQQFATADKSFANTQTATNNAMYARGAGDSSYNAAAQGQNQDIYNQDHQNMVNAEQQGLSGLGKYATTAKAGYQSGKDQMAQYDLSQYNDVPTLQALHEQLGQHIAGLQQQLAGQGTNQQYLDTVKQIAPIQSQASTQLAQKLATLANSSASPEAKDALMTGYISQAQLDDPKAKNYWTGYFQDLLKKGAVAPSAPTAPAQ